MLVPPSRAGFGSSVTSLWPKRADREGDDGPFARHQSIVAAFVHPATPYRGLLVFHGVGTGKTAAAVAAIWAWRSSSPSARVVVITPASLRTQFRAEMARVGRHSGDDVEFLSLNGLSARTLPSDFDGCLVVIDEAHNVSRALAGTEVRASLMRLLYERVRAARSARVVLLTATPVINRAAEIAYLANMVAGPQIEYSLRFMRSADDRTLAAVRDLLDADGRVDSFELTPAGAFVQLVDDARFRMSDKASGALVPVAPAHEHDASMPQTAGLTVARSVAKSVAGIAAVVPPQGIEHDLLPTDAEQFDATFVSGDALRRRAMLERRLVGRVSAFDVRDTADYPRVRHRGTVSVVMGRAQVAVYAQARAFERALGRRSSSSGGAETSVYRFYSRTASNFAFPGGVAARPQKFDTAALGGRSHERVTAQATAALRRSGFWGDPAALADHAPKFARIFDSISRPRCGKSMVFSSFRAVEGLGLFSEMLLDRGWRRISLQRGRVRVEGRGHGPCFVEPDMGSSSGPALIDLFNGRRAGSVAPFAELAELLGLGQNAADNVWGETVRTVLLSRSGAEGLNLREVRQVHIVEPHWNRVQTEQVAGRAIRMHSHARLPPNERDVSVYTYVALLPSGAAFESDAAHRVAEQLRPDNGVSTDEAIACTAAKKGAVADQIAEILRSAAVDCSEHAPPTSRSCYRAPERPGNLVPPDFRRDRDFLAPGRRVRVVAEDGGFRELATFPGTADLYDARKVSRDSAHPMHPVGFLTRSGEISWAHPTPNTRVGPKAAGPGKVSRV